MMGEGPVPAALQGYTGYLLSRLGGAAARRFERALEPEGLHPRHFGVMMIVAARPGMSQQRLHQETGIDPSSMVSVIDELEGRGLVERRPQPQDRRVRAIFLTEEGQLALERVRLLTAELQSELFAALNAAERSALHGLLLKLANANANANADADGAGGPAAYERATLAG